MGEPQVSQDSLLARIAGSAEYSIAVALLAVCLVVGGAWWFLRPQEAVTTEDPPLGPPCYHGGARGGRACGHRRLEPQAGRAVQRHRRAAAQACADEEVRRQRQRAEEVALAEARHVELAAQARKQAEARERELAASNKLVMAPPAPPARREPVRTEAAIDWSSCKRPSYPPLSVQRGEEGVVIAAADLDSAGQLRGLRVTQSSNHERLDKVTLDAIRKCRFAPARVDGVVQAGTAEVRLTWRLQD